MSDPKGDFTGPHLLCPDYQNPNHDKFKRLVRRLEHCARAREESTRILSTRFAERDLVRADLKREQEVFGF